MLSFTVIPKGITLSELDLRAGDRLVVKEVGEGAATLSLEREEPEDRERQARQFLEKWAGKFPVPENVEDEPRLAHLLEKHVK